MAEIPVEIYDAIDGCVISEREADYLIIGIDEPFYLRSAHAALNNRFRGASREQISSAVKVLNARVRGEIRDRRRRESPHENYVNRWRQGL